MEFKNAIFVVREEENCPVYNVGEEFRVEDMGLTVPEAKPVCLKLAQAIIDATTRKQTFERFTRQGIQKVKFECGGCKGIIRFEFKKEKGFATLQMKLLAEAEQRERMKHMDRFFDLLRVLDVFEPLDDDSLRDLSALLKLKEYAANKVVLKKGDPGTSLYIILEGKVAVIADDGATLSEMGVGEIFGEMSLLSGEPVTTTIHTRARTRLATLSSKDFKHILNRFPVLQVFFYKMLVDRAQANTLRAGTISSGMTGELSEINVVDLFQLINSSQKTGRVELELEDGKGLVLFREGELVQARYNTLAGKDAVFALLSKRQGRFTYHSGISPEAEKLEIIGGFMGLIMEGMRRIDEEEADEE